MTYRKVWEHDNEEYRAESADYLRRVFPIGSDVRTLVRSVSRSGMSRTISILAIDRRHKRTGEIVDVSQHVARVLGWCVNSDNGAIRVDGCGMDMCFHTVYALSRVLYRDNRRAERIATDRGYGTDVGYLLNSRII